MSGVLGTLVLDGNKLILVYFEGYKETFVKDKLDYSEGAQWIDWKGDRYFLKQD